MYFFLGLLRFWSLVYLCYNRQDRISFLGLVFLYYIIQLKWLIFNVGETHFANIPIIISSPLVNHGQNESFHLILINFV